MRSIWFLILLGSLITYHCFATVSGEAQESTEASQPTLEQCKTYVDAALKTSSPSGEDSEEGTLEETSGEDDDEPPDSQEALDETTEDDDDDDDDDDQEDSNEEDADSQEDGNATTEADDDDEDATEEATEEEQSEEVDDDATAEDSTKEDDDDEDEGSEEEGATAENKDSGEDDDDDDKTEEEDKTEEDDDDKTVEDATAEEDTQEEGDGDSAEDDDATTEQDDEGDSKEGNDDETGETQEDGDTAEDNTAEEDDDEDASKEQDTASAEQDGGEDVSAEASQQEESGEDEGATAEDDDDEQKSEEDDKSVDGDTAEDTGEEEESNDSVQGDVADEADQPESTESQEDEATQEDQASTEDTGSPETEDGVSDEDGDDDKASDEDQAAEGSDEEGDSEEDEEEEEEVEPYEPRSRDHITDILGLDDSDETKNAFSLLDKATQSTLKELKSTYENAIKPLEQLYKYRDLSNRHFADPEIFSKPLIVFMGPWSGGKSTIINWLLGIQHEDNALRTGADPSPAQFNIMMYGNEPEKLDGTQLAADWTFSGLQKFGQSFLDRLRGQKLPNRLLEKVNIVEIPGILEVRKQVERSFPFNDACQWFIDRADTLFLVYDPAKLDIGPETEAILDQLKGRENQVRIVLNKADTVKPDELLRVQAMLVWNISPLMSSAEPPVMYAASLWDRPLQTESPKSLLIAHENNFLKDIRDGIERRVETRIAAARRFAVRVRNHAKMVDCYLNTYNNHRSFFSDKKKVSTDIIDHPQNYHIYEGLSTLTNISRYDLPDPDTYRDFFRLNPLWDFPTLPSTCSFFKGCPLHKLDIAIAYDLPEILGKFRRQREAIITAKYHKASSK